MCVWKLHKIQVYLNLFKKIKLTFHIFTILLLETSGTYEYSFWYTPYHPSPVNRGMFIFKRHYPVITMGKLHVTTSIIITILCASPLCLINHNRSRLFWPLVQLILVGFFSLMPIFVHVYKRYRLPFFLLLLSLMFGYKLQYLLSPIIR